MDWLVVAHVTPEALQCWYRCRLFPESYQGKRQSRFSGWDWGESHVKKGDGSSLVLIY
jgi:hypothetical protein